MFTYKEEVNNQFNNEKELASSLKNPIKKVCVIGAGVMGSGIAALIANSSTEVVLLDIPGSDSNNRNEITQKALEKILTQKPQALTHPSKVKYISIGNLEDDLNLLKDCDLIIEVIIEKIEIKHQLYKKLLPFLKESAILTSNTSTLPLRQLKEIFQSNIRRRFLITHFFNPPRYMELLELVSDEETDPQIIKILTQFLHESLGKNIINCNDTPGFIANRIGCFILEMVVRQALKMKLNPHIIDQIFTTHLGFPSTGIFGLYDLIGHDVMRLISSSLIKNLPAHDLYHEVYITTPLLDKMIEQGFIGRKGKGGFYHILENNGEKIKEVLSYQSNISSLKAQSSDQEWSPVYTPLKIEQEKLANYSSFEEFLKSDTIYSTFLNEVLGKFYIYLFNLIPTISDNIIAIDIAMRLGYSWKYGPFELFTKLLPDSYKWLIKQTKIQNLSLPDNFNINFNEKVKNTNFYPTRHHINKNNIIISNDDACLHTINNSLIFSFLTKMNCLTQRVFELMLQAVDYAEKNNKNLYFYSPTPHFCAGADLKYITSLIENKDFSSIENFIRRGQEAMMRLKYSPINIISCATGAALGGGMEILLHSSHIIAHSELKAGLVEVGVGLLPGWGGTKEMFLKSRDDKEILIKNLSNIILANKSSSADYLVSDYNITNINIIMNKENLLDEALKINIQKNTNFYNEEITIPQINLAEELAINSFNELQLEILSIFQEIINLKQINEMQLFEIERENFLKLCKNPLTITKLKAI